MDELGLIHVTKDGLDLGRRLPQDTPRLHCAVIRQSARDLAFALREVWDRLGLKLAAEEESLSVTEAVLAAHPPRQAGEQSGAGANEAAALS